MSHDSLSLQEQFKKFKDGMKTPAEAGVDSPFGQAIMENGEENDDFDELGLERRDEED